MNRSYNTDLNDYVSQCKMRLLRILNRLEWTEELTLKYFNSNSVASAFKKLEKKPRTPPKATFPDSCIIKNSLVLESSKLQEILENSDIKAPCNFRELQANFSREEKLKIYEHVIKHTEKLDNNTIAEEVKGEISLADILAQKKRDEKRKKRRFRKSKPTHIEEVRSLVDLQMQALQQFMNDKTRKEKQINRQGGSAKNERPCEDDNRKPIDYYDRKQNREKTAGEYKGINYVRKDNRSRSKEIVRHKHTRLKRSLSKELSHTKQSLSKGHSKEINYRRKRHRSRSKEEHTRHKRKRHKSLSKTPSDTRESYTKSHCKRRETNDKSSSKEISNDITTCISYRSEKSEERQKLKSSFIDKSPSKERKKLRRRRGSDTPGRRYHTEISNEEEKNMHRYSRKEKKVYGIDTGEKHIEYSRQDSMSSERHIFKQQITETTKTRYDEYKTIKSCTDIKRDKYSADYKIPCENKEKSSNHKRSKHKKKKHKRDYS